MILDYQIDYLFQTCKGGFDKPTQKLIELLLRKKCETQHRLDLIDKCKKAAELYTSATLPIGDGQQSPDEFVRAQSASTGLPEHMCRANMEKNAFVLTHTMKAVDVPEQADVDKFVGVYNPTHVALDPKTLLD